jgi:hypothetical protein
MCLFALFYSGTHDASPLDKGLERITGSTFIGVIELVGEQFYGNFTSSLQGVLKTPIVSLKTDAAYDRDTLAVKKRPDMAKHGKDSVGLKPGFNFFSYQKYIDAREFEIEHRNFTGCSMPCDRNEYFYFLESRELREFTEG